MNGLIAAYEKRLSAGADALAQLERRGQTGPAYERRLREWLELLAAYEYECEMSESVAGVLAAAI